MHVITSAVIRSTIRKIDEQIIDISKISENSFYEHAVAFNRLILAGKRALYDCLEFAKDDPAPRLKFFDQLQKSTLSGSVLEINSLGILRLTQTFYVMTGLYPGDKVRPAFNEDEWMDSLYFIKDNTGLKLTEKALNIQSVMDILNKIYPLRVVWNAFNYEGRKAFQIVFPTL